MRRKSARNASKASPEKPVKEVETPPKTRRSRRRKRSPSKSSESEEEVIRVTRRAPLEDTPDTTTKSHSPSDEETSQEPVWKVTSSDDAPRGEIQKLKICLTRPTSDSPDKLKARRSKSRSQTEDDATTSSEDKSSTTTRQTRSRGSSFVAAATEEDAVDEKKGKGKSKGKHKSKIEQSAHLNDETNEMPPTSIEISENAQVTPLSPTIDKPVDIENDRKNNEIVDGDDKVCKNVNAEKSEGSIIGDCADREVRITETNDDDKVENDSQQGKANNAADDDEDEDEPLSVIQKVVREENKQEKVDPDGEEIIETPQDQDQEEPQPPQTVIVQEVEKEKPQVEEEKLEDVKPEAESATVQDNAQDIVQAETITEIPAPEIVEVAQDSPKLDEEEPMDISTDISFSITDPAQTVTNTEPKADEVEEEQSKEEERPTVVVAHTEEETAVNNHTNDNKKEEEEDGEIKSTESLLKDDPIIKEPKIRKRLIRRDLLNEKEVILKEMKSEERQKWSFSFDDTFTKIDLESLTALYPDIEFPAEPDLVVHEPKERRRSSAVSAIDKLERTVSVDTTTSVDAFLPSDDGEDKSNIIAFNRKISIVDDTASKLKPPPSPAKNPVADVLYITNLVRPFTLKQLRELLERTGKIQENGFWTDRIKSKCYVHYETQEEAEATRNALHGVQWPIGNGKKLMIEFGTVEDLENAKNPPPPPVPVAAAVLPDIKASLKENTEPLENKSRHQEERKSKDEDTIRKKEAPVREWDIGKEMHNRDRSRSRDRNRKHRRSASPIIEDFISKKHRKEEEAVPRKLMDDLFLKTKATPSIYWQPLSPDEIAMKQQQRLVRMEEHKRRMEETSRFKGRDSARGAPHFRRRYD